MALARGNQRGDLRVAAHGARQHARDSQPGGLGGEPARCARCNEVETRKLVLMPARELDHCALLGVVRDKCQRLAVPAAAERIRKAIALTHHASSCGAFLFWSAFKPNTINRQRRRHVHTLTLQQMRWRSS